MARQILQTCGLDLRLVVTVSGIFYSDRTRWPTFTASRNGQWYVLF